MKILLDECVPRKFAKQLGDHEVETVPDAGFGGKNNGELLRLAEDAGFQLFLTVDRGVEYQQNLLNRRIAIVLITAKTNRFADLLPLIPEILNRMESIEPGELVRIGN